jgi:feruloyl-CoA synthase
VISACEPLVQDCVITGHDRRELGVLLFPNLAACRACAALDPDASARDVIDNTRVREAIAHALAEHNLRSPGSSTQFTRALMLAEPPSIDANEITDKGYINQRAVLTHRATLVEALYADDPGGISTKIVVA